MFSCPSFDNVITGKHVGPANHPSATWWSFRLLRNIAVS